MRPNVMDRAAAYELIQAEAAGLASEIAARDWTTAVRASRWTLADLRHVRHRIEDLQLRYAVLARG
jgi:hypothetical protein